MGGYFLHLPHSWLQVIQKNFVNHVDLWSHCAGKQYKWFIVRNIYLCKSLGGISNLDTHLRALAKVTLSLRDGAKVLMELN